MTATRSGVAGRAGALLVFLRGMIQDLTGCNVERLLDACLGVHPTLKEVAVLIAVLRSERAVQVGIGVVEAFVRLREMISSHEDLARRLDAMEKAYDKNFKQVFDGIRQLMHDTTTLKNKLTDRSQRGQRPRIGFGSKDRARGK